MLKNPLPIGSLSRRCPYARITALMILLLALSVAASAYTIVLRDGRRIEVTAEFALTQSTLTYEIAPGISRTIELILVDVPATERANHEAPGGFTKHTEQNLLTPVTSVPARAQRSLTNRDLESIQQRRIESERAYEKRRIELGLPSIEDSRRQQAQEDAATRDWLRQRSVEQRREESYWRERARALRGEISDVDAQVNYLRSRLSEFSQFPLATNSLVTSVLPLAPLNRTSAVVPWPGGMRGQVLIGSAPQPFRSPRLLSPIRGFGVSTGSVVGFAPAIGPFDYLEGSYERANFAYRLDTLLQIRAGLNARWRDLEDEARDARVPQVWLEP
jgi:hypothetical protein